MEWLIFILFSAVFLGVRQVISKKVLMHESTEEYLAAASLVTFLLSLFFLPRVNFALPLFFWFLMYLKTTILTISWFLGSKCLRHVEISMTIPLTNISPVFVIVLSIIFFWEFTSLTHYLGISLVVFSAYWLQCDGHFSRFIHPWQIFRNKYSIYMVFSMFFLSLCVVFDKIILKQVDVYTYLVFTFFVLSVHYLIIQLVWYNGLRGVKHAFINGKHFIFIVALLLLFTDLFYFKAVAVPGVMLSLLIPIQRLSTLVATIVGGRLFHEHNLVHRIIACALMIVGVVLIVI